ncbi:MAG: Crp/Fnr family transcriptional regulator [Bifidobacterium subtile]|nr:Crp/Fnr family transcriptional regulator [Bifidobacterium subtile]
MTTMTMRMTSSSHESQSAHDVHDMGGSHSVHDSRNAHVSPEHDHQCAGLVPLFAELPQSDQDFIDVHLQHRVFHKGEQVFMPGDELRLIIVARGSLKVYRMSRNGREQLLRVQEPGGYEGEAWLLGQPNDSLYGQALETTEVCLLSHRDFHKILLEQPLLSVRLLELNAAKLATLEQINGFLGMDRVEERLAAYLLDLSKASGSLTFTLPIRMKELAHLLGTTPETLSRKLRSFEDEGLIARNRRTLRILNQDALEDM